MTFLLIACLGLLTLSDVPVTPEKNKMERKYNLVVNDIPRCTRDEYICIYTYTYSQNHAKECVYVYDNIHKRIHRNVFLIN